MAQQQSNGNIQTAAANSYLNAVNQYTPYGSVQWRDVGSRKMGDGSVSIPIWEVHQTLSPEQQQLYNKQVAASSGALDLGQGYLSKIRDATANPIAYDEALRQQATSKIIERNQPQMERDRAFLEQRLADQGVGLQDPAYRTAMDQYQRGVNDFRLGADIQGGNEAQRSFENAITARQMPINEFAQMLGFGGTGNRQAQYVNTQQQPIQPTDYIGANQVAYQQAMQQQQLAQQQNNSMMGGLFGLGSAGIGAAGMYFGGAAML